jgi:hypothetical protein
MNAGVKSLLADFNGNPGASTKVLDAVEETWGHRLPLDYRQFMDEMDGGEGFIGKKYLIMWKAEQLLQYNQEYQVDEYAPGIFLFASSGGGEAFGFDGRQNDLDVVQLPFIGMSLQDAKKVANNFADLLSRLKSCDGSLLRT